jgi:hypothetical protein
LALQEQLSHLQKMWVCQAFSIPVLPGIHPRGKSVLPLHVAIHTNIETASLMFPFAAFNATELSIIHFL